MIKTTDLNPSQISTLCKWIVAGSEGPVLTALKVSAFLTRCSQKYLASTKEFCLHAESFTMLALSLLDDIESDHICAMLLEANDGLGSSCIEFAIESRNLQFLSSPRVARKFAHECISELKRVYFHLYTRLDHHIHASHKFKNTYTRTCTNAPLIA